MVHKVITNAENRKSRRSHMKSRAKRDNIILF